MALDQVIIKYGLELDEVKRELAELKKSLGGVDEQAKTSAAKTETALNSVANNVKGGLSTAFKQLGSVIAAAFAVQRIGAFITSSIELATRTQEIRFEFEKLNKPGLLANLKKATAGTLSDLKLMEVALRADKLGVPMEKLGKIMEFAKLRADALGKSTEELTDTLVQGIGIKGTRALVQVGISQEQFSAEVKKTGDYFTALDNIMTEALKNAGEGFDSVADKQDRLRANIENSKAAIGEAFLPAIDNLLSGISNAIEGIQLLFDGMSQSELDFYNSTVYILENRKMTTEEYFTALGKLEKQVQRLRDIEEDRIEVSSKEEQEAKKLLPLLEAKLQAFRDVNVAANNAKSVTQEMNKISEKNSAVTKENTEEIDKGTKATKEQTEEVNTLLKAHMMLGMVLGSVDQEFEDYIAELERLNNILGTSGGVTRNAATGISSFKDGIGEADETLDDSIEKWNEYGNVVFDVISSLTNYFQQQSDYRLELLNNELEAGKISQGQYDKDAAELRRKEAIRSKTLAIFDVLINTPPAIMRAAAVNPALAILAAIAGAFQLGAVINTPIPKFKKGVVGFKGKGSDTSDENLVLISNQESIITAKGTRKHKGVLDAINKDKFDEYIANNYLKLAFEKKSQREGSDTDYREYLELKRLGLINRNGFSEVVKALKENKPHRY